MKQFPEAPSNKNETGPEKVLTSAEVLEALSRFVEGNFTPGRELSDEKGVYLREVEVEGGSEGEFNQYQYLRRNDNERNDSGETVINVMRYLGGVPVTGGRVATFDGATGEWRRTNYPNAS